MNIFAYNLPLFLTLARLVISPLLLPFLFVLYLPLYSVEHNIILCLLFIAVCLTDFFDGYLARKYAQETILGRLLDPVADKFLLFSTVISLVYIQKIYFFWAIVLIGREFFILSLREIALYYGFSIPVSRVGKIKTAVQQLYIACAIANPYQHTDQYAAFFPVLEQLCLCIALFFTIYSAIDYVHEFRKLWLKKNNP